jgi:hypothetical protein
MQVSVVQIRPWAPFPKVSAGACATLRFATSLTSSALRVAMYQMSYLGRRVTAKFRPTKIISSATNILAQTPISFNAFA